MLVFEQAGSQSVSSPFSARLHSSSAKSLHALNNISRRLHRLRGDGIQTFVKSKIPRALSLSPFRKYRDGELLVFEPQNSSNRDLQMSFLRTGNELAQYRALIEMHRTATRARKKSNFQRYILLIFVGHPFHLSFKLLIPHSKSQKNKQEKVPNILKISLSLTSVTDLSLSFLFLS